MATAKVTHLPSIVAPPAPTHDTNKTVTDIIIAAPAATIQTYFTRYNLIEPADGTVNYSDYKTVQKLLARARDRSLNADLLETVNNGVRL